MNNLKYKHYSSEEFSEDKDFWSWVLKEGTVQDAFWENFIRENPDKAEVIARAKKIVLELNAEEFKMQNKQTEALWERIQKSVEATKTAERCLPDSCR
ncbi:hypothetical protein I2I11_12360 [Pontibacter sp. 172403-2]|uniref:hypothetical protein n=1 Tax=Pontibacter rufus TaxID=2791028 RepID=UPI0018AFDE1D|nr:hypothetical protein [Pontibacter sp. 172403-2]MBF9254088.1 hypothetical protein [Pontibacter sp. 172403-2]